VFILRLIIVGIIAGFITGKIMMGSGYGVLGDIIVGIIGAIVGGFIMRALGNTAAKTYLHHLRRGRRRGHPDVPVASHQRQSTLSLQSGP
jgi:uncharacterized membrane protein YeaQ/YmgE (transglycosylase-associated protein family)